MAEPTEGTYVILSVGSQKAIDVKGGLDKSGTNVQQYRKNNSDAQIWALSKPEGEYWQICCSLTGKVMDIAGAQVTSGTNVQQWDDKDNSRSQRWDIVDSGGTFTYSGVTYNAFYIKPSTGSTLALDVAGGSGADGANIRLYTANNSNAQKWIFIPISAMTEGGTYELVLASDTKMCAEVAESSTANSATIQVNSRNDSNNQIFRAEVNMENFLVTLFNANSDKVIDIAGGKSTNGTNVQQYTSNGSAAQKWLPVKAGSVTIDGIPVPTYEMRAQIGSAMVMDCQGGGKTAKTNIQIYTRNGSIAQRFAFNKTEAVGTDIDMPGVISPQAFSRVGHGTVTVTGLYFNSTENEFQARYMIRQYGTDTSTHTDTKWMNLADDSTSRSGWGDAWTSTFRATPVNGRVTLPFTKTITLGENSYSADIIIEVRVYKNEYGSGYKAHGPVASTTISVVEEPVVDVTGMSVVSSGDSFAISADMEDSLGIGCTWIRGRLVGDDDQPISAWVSNTNESLAFDGDGVLSRLPRQGEVLSLEYSMMASNGASVIGSTSYTFQYGSDMDPMPTVTYTDDDSYCAIIEADAYDKILCFMPITTDFENRLIRIPAYESSNSKVKWRVLPPFNQTTEFTILAKNDSDANWRRGSVSCYIEAHEFMWTWTNRLTNDSCAAVFINDDTIPQQTRSYTPSVSFAETSARRYPVAFATRMTTVDLSIEAVVVDEDASYTSAKPLPNFTSLYYIRRLIRLAGDGVHPIYRTPYGDWYIVGIESIDISKLDMQLSKAVIKQRAVED